LLPSKQ